MKAEKTSHRRLEKGSTNVEEEQTGDYRGSRNIHVDELKWIRCICDKNILKKKMCN